MASNGAHVFILTGAPGSGKTTVAGLLAARTDRAVHMESDCFFHFIKAGYVEPWKPESHEQNQAVMRVVAEAAAGYAEAGYFTIIDGIISPRWFLPPPAASLDAAGFRIAYAVLRPSLLVARTRAEQRSASRLSDAAVIEQLWESFAELGPLEKHVIDNSSQSAEQTAEQLADLLRLGELTLA